MKKQILFLIGAFLVLGMPFLVGAQESTSASRDVLGVSSGSGKEYVPEVSIKLGDILFNEATREITAVTKVTNTTNDFLSNLQYTMELLKGDSLNKNGYIFANAAHTYQQTSELGKLAPGESKEFKLKLVVPSNIETSNYFLQIFVNDRNISFQNVAYTPEAFELKGLGGLISDVKMYFYANRYAEKQFPSEGLSTEPKDQSMIMIPLAENIPIKKIVTAGQILKAKIKIFRTVKDNGLVKEFEMPFQRKEVAKEDSLTVDLLADNDELRGGGSFDVNVAIINEKGEELYNRNMRWLIEYGQMMGRILAVESGKNVYKQGEAIDLTIKTALFNNEGQQGEIGVVLTGRNGFEQHIAKEVVFNKALVNEFNFADMKISRDAHLTHIAVSLTDVKNNIIVDAYDTDIDFDQAYGGRVENQIVNPVDKKLNKSAIAWVIIGILFLVSLLVVIVKNKRNKKTMQIGLMFIFSMGMFLTQYHSAMALCTCKESGSDVGASFWMSTDPWSASVSCGGNATMGVSLLATCPSCVNGMAAQVTSTGTSGTASITETDLGGASTSGVSGGTVTINYGHVTNPTLVFDFTQKISSVSGEDMSATAKYVQNGCHCCPGIRPVTDVLSTASCLTSHNDGIADGNHNADGVVCAIDKSIDTITRKVGCVANITGVCDSDRIGTYAYDALTWRGAGYCATGNYKAVSPLVAPFFPAQGATTTWKCEGSGSGTTADCSASRNVCVPTTICGAANTICSGEICDTGCGQVTGNMPCTPTVPAITGPTTGYINTNYNFTATSTDPNGDTLHYGFDWDSNGAAADAWAPASGYLASGTGGTLPYQWSSIGAKVLRAMACDSPTPAHCSAWSGNHTITLRAPACTGANPPTANSVFCTGSDSGLTVDVTRQLFPSCSTNKCAYKCDNSNTVCGGTTYVYDSVGPKCNACTINCACAATTCIGKTCDSCGVSLNGTKDCRDLNWREVAPN